MEARAQGGEAAEAMCTRRCLPDRTRGTTDGAARKGDDYRMSLVLGDVTLETVSGGRLWLDGGTMFGVVPKVRWQRKYRPDEYNRIGLDTNCLLVRTPAGNVLVDTGYGSKCDARDREHCSLEDGCVLLKHLGEIGVGPSDIDWVILSHLHFDHAGGCTSYDASERPRPTFPRAHYVIQRREWEDATGDLPELTHSYNKQDFLAIREAGRLHLADGDADVLANVSVRLTGGHTRGHQVVIVESRGQRAVYLGDLCPTTAHLRRLWTMAYDMFPLDVRRIKPVLLGELADNGWLAVFDHDPEVKAAYLRRDEHDAAIREVVSL